MKLCFIIRGISGSGKSTLAKSLASMNIDHCICEADSYFYNESGQYVFKPESLSQAHLFCRDLFSKAVEKGTSLVICSNTNTTKGEYKFYLDKALKMGYTTHVVVTERFLETKSVHNVPKEVLDRQVDKLRQSIQL